jgi:hypothetical protein
MSDVVVKFSGHEIIIDRDVTTIGRVSENDVSFPDDSNVSRYHAEIERRGGDHWLIDLKSSNGTTVNGERVTGERMLAQGDKLAFGGSSEAEFLEKSAGDDEADKDAENASGTDVASEGGDSPDLSAAGNAQGSGLNALGSSAAGSGMPGAPAIAGTATASSSGSTVLIAGIVVGLAVVCAVAAGAFYLTRGSACAAKAQIIKPETGDTISSPVDMELDARDAGCVQSAIFTIDGQQVASADAPSFAASLDPKDFPELADGADHSLQVVLVDNKGTQIPQPGSVILAFETRVVTKPSPTPGTTTASNTPSKQSGKMPSLVQINEMAQKLLKQFSGNLAYNVSNKQFLQEIQKRTSDYAQDGYSPRAAAYREIITVAFFREQNIDPPLGFILAMSRSKFVPAKQGDREGLWQLPATFINENKYNGQCPNESLSDPAQNCAARSAALYTKALLFSVFDGDPIYTAAAFGKSPQDAGAWKATLPQNRSDLWNTIRTPEERDQLVRYFAAGIVSENPQAFGLTKDRPLSELYRVTLQ